MGSNPTLYVIHCAQMQNTRPTSGPLIAALFVVSSTRTSITLNREPDGLHEIDHIEIEGPCILNPITGKSTGIPINRSVQKISGVVVEVMPLLIDSGQYKKCTRMPEYGDVVL